ncbi:hypothetical protein Bealeia1_01814 [Candidatus Bealeia paramacronuclearis]|uniref:Uncharacterized protein n=1 Tax=Candidatus Bealeia paramacronuclearis TaxID=1921001 RepID=A0ABZ2C597_9PROT|nr:hypothetical protein [Candidatus Bealeia paramacronuclearis]
MLRKYRNENLALYFLWIQLILISALIGIYFESLAVNFSIWGLGMIFYSYTVKSFLPAKSFNFVLSTFWLNTAILWGNYIDRLFDTAISAIILSVIALTLSYWINKFLVQLWLGNDLL